MRNETVRKLRQLSERLQVERYGYGEPGVEPSLHGVCELFDQLLDTLINDAEDAARGLADDPDFPWEGKREY